MEKIRICSTINPDGSIQEGSGIELDTGGPTAKLLQQVTTHFSSG